MDRDLLRSYCEKKLSHYKIGKIVGLSPTGVRYWLKKYGLKTDIYKSWNEESLRLAVLSSFSIREALVKLNKNCSASNYNSFKRNINRFNIDISHFKAGTRPIKQTIPDDIVFVKDSLRSRAWIKKRIIENKLIEYRCAICEMQPEWNNKTLTLILDHINGNAYDNRLSNLRFVCPNCNSQLLTHCKGEKGVQLNESSSRLRTE